MTQLPAALLAPMAIAPGWRDAMAREWMRWTPGARLVVPGKAPAANAPTTEAAMAEPAAVDGSGGLLRVVNGIGVISVSGPLTNDTSEWAEFITSIFGGTQYASIWRALEMARSMSQVQRILMRFGTPGGDADGCGQLGRFIYETRQVKPIRAHVDTLCASAGIWLASQCEEISSVAEGELGSIGVRCSWIDFSKFDEQMGIERGECVSSLSPGKRSLPFDDEVKGRIQARIDDLAELFVAAVARGRDTDRETVITQYGAGDVMIASRALEAGLVDEVCDFNQALASFAAAPTRSPEARAATRAERKASTMTIKPKANEETSAGLRCAKCDADCNGKSVYCATCYDDEPDGDEEAKALAAAGLRGKTRSETRGKLASFAMSVLEATGAKTGAAAIVKAISAIKAEGDLATFVAESEKSAASARAKAVSDKLGAAITSGKVTMGMVSKEVPILSGAPKAKVREALGAITAQDAASVVGAVVSAGVSEEFAASVDEWLESKGAASALPTPHRQPGAADSDANAAVKPPAITLPGDPAGTPLSIDSVLKKAAEAKK